MNEGLPVDPVQAGSPGLTRTERDISAAKTVLLQNYKQQPVVLVKGEGVHVWDAEGRRYLDLICGIATCAMGHCHPVVLDAARRQLETLWHASNAFYTEPQVALAERLTKASGLPGAQGLLLQLGRRGQRGVDQGGSADPARGEEAGRALRAHHLSGRLPRANAGHRHRHGPAEVPAGLRAAARGVSLRSDG